MRTPRQQLIGKSLLWLKDNPGVLSNDRLYAVIEGRARAGSSAMWRYYEALTKLASKRLLNAIRRQYAHELKFSKPAPFYQASTFKPADKPIDATRCDRCQGRERLRTFGDDWRCCPACLGVGKFSSGAKKLRRQFTLYSKT
jgi:hypothetical protein